MKSFTKFALAAFSLAIVGVSTSLADSHENQIRLHIQQQEMPRQQASSPSVAVYTSRYEVDRSTWTRDDRSESRESRYNMRDDRREHVYGTWLKK
jgi:hypothetical protein